MIIGVTLAKRLQVSIGDKVVVTSSRKGELQGFPFRVAGTFEVGSSAMDASIADEPTSKVPATRKGKPCSSPLRLEVTTTLSPMLT